MNQAMDFEPKWITPAITLSLHDRQLAEHGGQSGLREEGLMLSALAAGDLSEEEFTTWLRENTEAI